MDSPSNRRTGPGALIRLGAAGLVVGVALLALWQAGVLFQPEDDTAAPDVEAASAGLDTPAVDGRSVGLREGNIAPDFEFSSFDGLRSRLSDYRGRIVVLNFWATWCIPCKAELPDLNTLLERTGDDKLAVLAMNYGESYSVGERFITQLDVRLTAFGYDPEQAVARRYGIEGLPVSYFIDADGVVARVITGQLTPALIEAGMAAAEGRVSN